MASFSVPRVKGSSFRLINDPSGERGSCAGSGYGDDSVDNRVKAVSESVSRGDRRDSSN